MSHNKWIWPLPGELNYEIPDKDHHGAFGATRKFDRHCGVDLYCKKEQEVVACEDGIVVEIENFTGQFSEPPTPWWNNTKSVIIKGDSGNILYGEIEPCENITKGIKVKAGDLIGKVVTVLKHDKGLPMNMLHLELYGGEFEQSVIWCLNDEKPNNLLNPTEFLKQTIKK